MFALAALLQEAADWRQHGGDVHQAAAASGVADKAMVDGRRRIDCERPRLPAADRAAATLRRPRRHASDQADHALTTP